MLHKNIHTYSTGLVEIHMGQERPRDLLNIIYLHSFKFNVPVSGGPYFASVPVPP